MIRWLRYLFLIALALSLLTVALANRAPVVVKTLPDDMAAFLGFGWSMELPLFVVIFAGIVAGLLIGFLWEWFREHKHRAAAATKAREVAQLRREVASLRDAKAQPKDDVLALLDSRKAG
ncbi:LapA family protein [Fertoebacter nigrum]|uniref:LapA family protein n=1 Tax=Fertoeibacter niger TaxID=2656921 RepID=A0A8X8KMR4_9RHOB|nr:LapA family protein [Fertoeibacter niger]NUB44195.1 LapA family protein [Fertoeibacter niger]